MVDAENRVTLSGTASQPGQIPLRDVEDQLPAGGQVAAHTGKTPPQVLDGEQVQQRVARNEDGREPGLEIELAHIRMHERNVQARGDGFRPRAPEHGRGKIGSHDVDALPGDWDRQAARSAPEFQHAAAALAGLLDIEPL